MIALKLIISIIVLMSCSASQLNLTIIHNNDIHSRFVSATNLGEDCEPSTENGCFGGIPRILYMVKRLRKQIPNLLYLNAGDNFTGTPWYNLFRWQLWATVVKYMKWTAMSFGNHEFDDGPGLLSNYVSNISKHTKTLACNVDLSRKPEMRTSVKKSTIVTIEGRKIGIIGYVTPDTAAISNSGPLIPISDEIECIRKEVMNLKKKNVNIFIALGHSGFQKDKEIARQVPDIDIVVGGHTNTFLYNGVPPSNEKPSDVYPVVIKHKDNRQSLVVQDFAYGKYLGYLNVLFNEKGDIINYSGQPILLDNSVPEDKKMKNYLQPKYSIIKNRFNSPIGTTAVFLDGDCRKRECNLGNMVTDAMVSWVINHEKMSNATDRYPGWSKYPVALVSGGNIRSSVNEMSNNGKILLKDVYRIYPFDDEVCAVTVTGKVLKEVFEHSVSRYDPNNPDPEGMFAQVSGFRVKYDVSMPVGQRVVRIEVRCGECRTPKFEPLNEFETYNVITNTYNAGGGDLYAILKTQPVVHFKTLSRDAIIKYIKTQSTILTGLEGRSVFVRRPRKNINQKY